MPETWEDYLRSLERQTAWIAHCHVCGWVSPDQLAITCNNGHVTHVDDVDQHILRRLASQWN
jgi:hypothetical protein